MYFLQKRYNKHNKQRKYDRHYTLQEIFIPCIVNCQSLEEYQGNLLLVGINYDVKTKEHSGVIEEFVKYADLLQEKRRESILWEDYLERMA